METPLPLAPGCTVAIHPACGRMALSRCGRIWVYRTKRGINVVRPHWAELKGCVNKDGHKVTTVSGYGKKTQLGIHVLVLETFVSPRPLGLMACHENDIPTDNRVSNLYWGTMKDNSEDSVRNGRTYRGAKCHKTKLTEDQVVVIRRRYAEGGISQQALANEFGVNQSAISYLILRKSWTHV